MSITALVRLHVIDASDGQVVLPGFHTDDGAEGIASPDGRPCEALAVSRGSRCPKPSAVVLAIMPGPSIALCGSHYGVHRDGKRVVLPDRVTP